PRRAALAHAHGDLAARVVQVLRVRVALRAVADDRDLATLDQLDVAILVVEDFHSLVLRLVVSSQAFRTRSPRAMPEAPVRTVSRIAVRSRASMKASSLVPSPVSSIV